MKDNISKIIESLGEFLGVRKDLMDKDYVGIPIGELREVRRDLPIDVYLRLSDSHYVHVFSRQSGINYKRLGQYVEKGVSTVYVLKSDYDQFKKFAAISAADFISDKKQPLEKRVAALLNLTEQTLAESFLQSDLSDRSALGTVRLVGQYVGFLMENPKALTMLMQLASHGEYLFSHTIAVTVTSLILAKDSGEFDVSTLGWLGLGAFLHDLGCVYLPQNHFEENSEIHARVGDAMSQHPRDGVLLVNKSVIVPEQAQLIILQHHEQPGGGGYPNRLKGEQIFFPARLVAVADAHCTLTQKRPNAIAAPLSPVDAIEYLEKAPHAFDAKIVGLLKTSLVEAQKISQKTA